MHSAESQSNGSLPGNLDILTSGQSALEPAKLFATDNLRPFFDQLRRTDYKYILIDSAPLLGIADSQALMRFVDKILMVARLDRLTTENVIESEELLSRLAADPVGVIVVGASAQVSPYYLGQRGQLLGVGP